MNKIERAIYDLELQITDKQRKLLIAQTELTSLRESLQTLQIIRDNKSIPNQ